MVGMDWKEVEEPENENEARFRCEKGLRSKFDNTVLSICSWLEMKWEERSFGETVDSSPDGATRKGNDDGDPRRKKGDEDGGIE